MPDSNQSVRDIEHLNLLAVFHYVVGGFAALGGCCPIFHLIMGLFITVMAIVSPGSMESHHPAVHSSPESAPAAVVALIGGIFIIIPLVIMLCAWTLAVVVIMAGVKLSRRKSYQYCYVVAVILCMFMPLGTILGVFTLIVLMRPSVKAMFKDEPVPLALPPN